MEDYGLLVLLPPVIAIVLCFITRRVLVSLFLGIFAGGIIISGWNPFEGLVYSIDTIIGSISDSWNASLLLFNLLMGAGIAFIWKLGGSQALANWAKEKLKSKRQVGIGSWLLGIIIFFNDYVNAAIVGSVFRDIYSSFKISKEKLSYVLDSTAAPVATFFISDWIAFQIGMVKEGIDQAGITTVEPFTGYLQSIPLNIYCIFAVIFVGIIVISRMDWGPMLKAEKRAEEKGEISRPGSAPMLDVDAELGEVVKDVKPRMITFFLPIIVLVAVTLFGFYWTGRGGANLTEILENTDAAKALLWGAFGMTLTGIILSLVYRAMKLKDIMDTIIDGMKMMLLACSILVLAWSIGNVTSDMNLAGFVITAVGDNIPFTVIPLIIFFIGMLIAFSTGTSWGTMTILTPIAIPLVYRMTGDAPTAVMMAGIVFSGAIFGDHCSPISDTTVLSSIFSGSDHMDHVLTQIPYAILCAIVAAIMYLMYGLFSIGNNFVAIGIGIAIGIVVLIIANTVLNKAQDTRKSA
jgi:Na+/H+ antiporter NhaC